MSCFRLAGLRVTLLFALATLFLAGPALAQGRPGAVPVVGVVKAEERPVYQSNTYLGRIEAINRVNLTARVTGFLEKRLFKEGDEVKAGQLLFVIEQAPYKAAVQQAEAAVDQAQAQLTNAELTLQRAQQLLHTPAGQQSTVDSALAQEQSDAAQLLSAKAQLETAQINLGYTEIRAPVSGRIGLAKYTVGNVVGPTSGTLATIVSQNPMYVTFPVAMRDVLALRQRYADEGGMKALEIKLRLPGGQIYSHMGTLNFVDISVASTTDTLLLRGTIPNPLLPNARPDGLGERTLTDGEFVTVILQGVKPVMALTVPRYTLLADQEGSYVYIVGKSSKVERRNVTLGKSTPSLAVILSGLKPGEQVIADGIQRVRPGLTVKATPAEQPPVPEQAIDPVGQ